MTEHEMLEAVIEGYQVELHRFYHILRDWNTEQSHELATQISAGLLFRGKKEISSRLAELEAENLRLRLMNYYVEEKSEELRSLLRGRDAE